MEVSQNLAESYKKITTSLKEQNGGIYRLNTKPKIFLWLTQGMQFE